MGRYLLLLCGLALLCLPPAAGAATVPPVACAMPMVLVLGEVEMVPLAPFAEVVGAAASEDMLTGAVTITRGKNSFTCTPDQKSATANGKPVELPMAPFIRRAALYVPLRAAVAGLQGTVNMDNEVRNSNIRVRIAGDTELYKFPRQTIDDLSAIPSWAGEVYIANPDGSGCKRLTYDLEGKEDPSLSPDGKSLLYCRGYGVALRDLDSHYEMMLIAADQDFPRIPKCRFSPDGQQIFVRGEDAKGWYVGYMQSDGQGSQRLPDLAADFAFSPDGKHIAYSTFEVNRTDTAHIYLMDLDGKHKRDLGGAGYYIHNLHFNRNGTILVGEVQYYQPVQTPSGEASESNQSLLVCELTGEHAGILRQPPESQRNRVRELQDVSADGRYFLYKYYGPDYQSSRASWLCNSDISNVRQLPLGPSYENIGFSTDGKNIIYNEGDAAYAMAPDTFAITPIPYACPARMTPDGKYLLYVKRPDD